MSTITDYSEVKLLMRDALQSASLAMVILSIILVYGIATRNKLIRGPIFKKS